MLSPDDAEALAARPRPSLLEPARLRPGGDAANGGARALLAGDDGRVCADVALLKALLLSVVLGMATSATGIFIAMNCEFLNDLRFGYCAGLPLRDRTSGSRRPAAPRRDRPPQCSTCAGGARTSPARAMRAHSLGRTCVQRHVSGCGMSSLCARWARRRVPCPLSTAEGTVRPPPARALHLWARARAPSANACELLWVRRERGAGTPVAPVRGHPCTRRRPPITRLVNRLARSWLAAMCVRGSV